MEHLHFSLTMFGILFMQYSDCTDITMSIGPQEIFENNSVTFKCSAGYEADTLAFFLNEQSPNDYIVFAAFKDSNCTIQSGIKPEFVDQCTCDHQNKSIKCIIATISRWANGFWQCKDFLKDINSAFVELRVTVPITEAIIQAEVQNVVTINETKQLSLKCEAPNGNPSANISWFLDNKTPNQSNDDIDITEFSAVTIQSIKDGTKTANSSLSYNASAEHNGMVLYCTASNIAEVKIFSRRIHLDIRYAPDKRIFVYNQTNDTDFYLIRNSNTRQSLQCQVDGGNPFATLKWSCYDGIQSDDNSQLSAISTVTWIAANLSDSTCICSASHFLGWKDRRVVYIHVLYEPNPPICTLGNANVSEGILNMTLNSDVSITCTSKGNPSPENFIWTWPTSHTSEGKNLSLYNVNISQNGLTTLSVQNIMEPSIGHAFNGRSNTTFDIHIQYGPRREQFYFGNMKTNITSRVMYVIKGENISVFAFADARPHPTFIWSNSQVGEEMAQIFHNDTNISCMVANVLYPTGFNAIKMNITKLLQIKVLYPPEVPILQLHACNNIIAIEDSIVKVVEGQPLNVTCFAKAKPEPTYRWNNINSSELLIANVTEINSATYVCYASNTMTTSDENTAEGQNETSFYLDVLYPPNITTVETRLVAIEGTNFSMYCNVSLGNPRNINVTWKSGSNATVVKVGQLIDFQNISRKVEGNFICVAKNKMTSTGCVEEDGVDEKHFHIDVQFKATIQRFDVVNATVNHTEDLSFECDVDSDPPANVSLVSTDGKTLKFTSGNNQLRHRKNSSCLEDIGNFTCISENVHNSGAPESRKVTIDVKCPPMYRPSFHLETSVTSKIGEKTMLYFSIFSNPLPTTVIWTNLSNNMQFAIRTSESDRVFITTSDDMLSSIFVIKTIETSDFGNYSVRVENEIGSKTETFYIVSDETSTSTGSSTMDVTSTNTIGAIVGGSVGVISGVVIVSVVVITVFYKRFRRLQGTPPRDNNNLFLLQDIRHESGKMEMESSDHVLPINDETPKYEDEKNIYGNIQTKDAFGKFLPIKTLRNTIRQLKLDPLPLFKEFYTLQMGLKYDTKDALKSNNVAKNRYRSVYPYDASRVTLPFLKGNPDSDFINATYIDGYSKPRKYIAAQGPLENTVDDTWRMIYSEDVKIIVMVTNLIETGKRKCFKYWPDDRASYGKCNVKLDQIEEYADFVVRHLTYSMEGTKFERQLIQFHYTSWPDKNVPTTALSLVQFWRKVRQSDFVDNTPWMVHCSAGVGRTGTFIALDYLYDQGKVDGKLSVPETVNLLREQRISMVQTKEQYLYLHEAITELLDPVGQIFTPGNSLRLRSAATEERKLNNEFQAITNSIVHVKSDFEENDSKRIPDGLLPENICKSVDKTVIPDDLFRPLISSGNDFINAVFIPTYRDAEKYIVTQYPLQNTVLDFVRLLWDHSIEDVVLLDVGDEKLHCYWPQNKSPLCIGPFVISLLSVDEGKYCTIRRIDISLAERRQNKQTVVHQFTAWPGYLHLCETKTLTEFLQEISRIAGPVVVQCHDGYSRSGLFAALLSIVDRIKTDKEVAIADTVRVVKHRRQAAITDVEQYQFCHEVVFEYLKGRENQTEEKENQEYVNMTFPKFL